MTWYAAVIAWLKGAWAWLVKHPKAAAFIAVVTALGVQAARILRLRRQVEAARAEADVARVEGEQAVQDHRAQDAAEKMTAAEKSADAHHQAAEMAQAEAADEVERRKWILKKYGPKAVILLAVLASMARADCPPDPDPSGLLAATRVTAGKLTGLDREAVSDLVAVVESYRAERASLCAALASREAEATDLRAALAASRDLAAVKSDSAAGYEKAWRDLLAKNAAARRTGRFGCTAGAGPGAPMDDLDQWAIMVSLTCGARVWP